MSGVILSGGMSTRMGHEKGLVMLAGKPLVSYVASVLESLADEIVVAAKAAGVHDFIFAQPQGYDTPVGERGMTLSGGERQRISLARAFLKDAPILILDEPTSSVDVKTEAVIIEDMERLMAGRTSFMIAHRSSTLERCTLRLQVSSGTVSVDRPTNEGVGAATPGFRA